MSKQNYRVRSKLEVFYTGGPARLSADGKLLACACADEVKVRCMRAREGQLEWAGAYATMLTEPRMPVTPPQVVEVATGAVVKTFAGVSPAAGLAPHDAC